jgi:hypothetical protein
VVVGQGSPPLAPVNISRPTIVGRAVLGQTLTEAHGGWTNRPAMFVYRWEDCDRSGNNCAKISGAFGQTYKVVASDLGCAIRVQETALNAGGTGGTASSAQIPVAPSTAMISASLRSQLVAHGHLARIAVLLTHDGTTIRFKALTAGQLLIRWSSARDERRRRRIRSFGPASLSTRCAKRRPIGVARAMEREQPRSDRQLSDVSVSPPRRQAAR